MAAHMAADDLVFGVIVKGQPRAYPRWILLRYHVVNDVINDEPLYLAHCEACSASSAFYPTVKSTPEGSLTFMICGLRGGTFEICDNQTLSRWHPFTGIARQGKLTGAAMQRIPVVLERWKTWADRFPNGEVVHAHRILKERKHGRGVPDELVHGSNIPKSMRDTANLADERLPTRALVFGLSDTAQTSAMAVPLDTIERNGNLYRVELQGRRYLLLKQGEYGVTAFRLQTTLADHTYRIVPGEPFVLASDAGGRWNELGVPFQDSSIKESLAVADGYLTKWYEWVTAYPKTEIAK